MSEIQEQTTLVETFPKKRIKFVIPLQPDGNMEISKVVFPGSFNPVHDGHIAMAKWAEKTFNVPISFEISQKNVDKPDLGLAELYKRVNSFKKYDLPRNNVVVTSAAKFVHKIKSFPPSTIFLLGCDTFNRLVDLKYYDNDASQFEKCVDQFVKSKVQFFVFHRLGHKLSVVDNKSRLIDIVKLVDESEYLDTGVSSTALRGEVKLNLDYDVDKSGDIRIVQLPVDDGPI